MELLQESSQKQTQVTAKLTSLIFNKQLPKTNVFFCPLSVHYMLHKITKEMAKGRTLKELLGFLKMETKHENDSFWSHFDNVLSKGGSNTGCFGIRYNTLFMTLRGAGPQPRFMNDHFARGGWFELFEFSELKEGEFYVSDGKKVKVVMMCKEKESYLFGEYDGFKVVGFPHFKGQDGGCKINVYVLLPDEKDGLEALVEKMGSGCDEFFERYIPEEKVELSEFAMPIFQQFSDIDVTASLKAMGLWMPFSAEYGTPDLFDPAERENVCVVGIHQNYGFSLLMNQTRSAAIASAETVGDGCLEKKAGDGCLVAKKVVDFVVDRPFVFVMRDEVTRAMFFMGQLIDPTVKINQMWYPYNTDA